MTGGGGSVRQDVLQEVGNTLSDQVLNPDFAVGELPAKLPILYPILSPTASGSRRKKSLATVLRDIRIHGDVAYVTLTRGYVATIDAADAALVGQYNWHAMVRDANVYAKAAETVAGQRRPVFMHRLILGLDATAQGQGDHRNGDGLNNRRENLREATSTQQMQNRRSKPGSASAYRGVSWNKERSRWVAKATIAGHRTFLGLFKTEEEAARAYEYAARIAYGEFYKPLAEWEARPPEGPVPLMPASVLARLDAVARKPARLAPRMAGGV